MSVPEAQQWTVLLRLSGLMQSWALEARGARRSTHTRPTKSGVIGLIANALGRDFTDSIDDLAALRFGTRVDAPGHIEIDYHTTGGGGSYQALPLEVARASKWMGDHRGGSPVLDRDGKQVKNIGGKLEFDGTGEPVHNKSRDAEPVWTPPGPDWITYAPQRDIAPGSMPGTITSKEANANITNDEYLVDASFVVAVEGTDRELMEQIAAAIVSPARALFLGRKAYSPAVPVDIYTAPVEEPLEQALAQAPYDTDPTGSVALYFEPKSGSDQTRDALVVSDQPVSFNGPLRRVGRLEASAWITPPRSDSDEVDPTDEADSIADSFFSATY
ncbi:CRISPR-associated protein Cas5 [Mycolicibacterium conceptionense]|uniref:CRISPR-associated protein Cas5 n=1 Tax=Mycolicibacterium conceptionense TaxID=451644 RepID=UPI00069E5467|nr:CRISPR-associated protein Cas5 [Mycolicibacterium conceptionense]